MKQTDLNRIYSIINDKLRTAWKSYTELDNWYQVFVSVALSRLHIRQRPFRIVSRSGVTLLTPAQTEAYSSFFEVFVWDAYRIKDVNWKKPEMSRLVLDVGAHIGSFTCTLASLLPGASFVCVEPSASSTKWLQRNLELNQLTRRSTVISAAVTSVDGPVTLWGAGELSSGNSLNAPGSAWKQTDVTGLSIDSLFSRLERLPDIVKLDCEGGEYDAILGGHAELWKDTNHLFLEYHRGRFSELVNRIGEFGLRLVWHEQNARHEGIGMAYFNRNVR